MAADPSDALQAALVTALKGDPAVSAIIADRVYDQVPPGAVFPYLVIGDDQVIADDLPDLPDGDEPLSQVFARIHAWSRATGFPEVKDLAGKVRNALRGAALSLDGFRLDVRQHLQTRYLVDPDGLTRHAVVEFKFLVTHLT